MTEKFILTPEHDQNHVFEEEKQMLEELRKHPEAQAMSDKYLLVFLIGRKYNLERAIETIKNYLKLRKDIGFENKPITVADLNPQMAAGGSQICYPTHLDKEGRLVLHLQISRWLPKKYTLEQMLISIFYFWQEMWDTQPLSTFRKGVVMVQDMKGAGLANLDTSSKGRKWGEALQNNFPTRLSNIYIVNGGWIVKVLLGFAKLVFKKKMVKRIQLKKCKNRR